nr:cytidine deaminase [Desulfitobacterium chlororespirans]
MGLKPKQTKGAAMDSPEQISPELIEELIRRAQAAYQSAYVPYSHYPVGAATLWESGRISAGCNVENASYGLTICAERNAVFHGAYHGERRLKAVAVAVPTDTFPSPCGACRQVLREFSQDCLVILVNGKGQTKTTRLSVLLPDSFGPEFLG